MVDKHSLLDVNKIDEFHNGIRNNQIICPKFQYCGSSGTFVRREIFNLLKFGGKGGGKVLNQRAEQSKRAEYKNFILSTTNYLIWDFCISSVSIFC